MTLSLSECIAAVATPNIYKLSKKVVASLGSHKLTVTSCLSYPQSMKHIHVIELNSRIFAHIVYCHPASAIYLLHKQLTRLLWAEAIADAYGYIQNRWPTHALPRCFLKENQISPICRNLDNIAWVKCRIRVNAALLSWNLKRVYLRMRTPGSTPIRSIVDV